MKLFAQLALALCVLASPALAADDEADFKPLFNGKDLAGWDGNPKFWSVKDGVVVGQTTADNPTQGNTFLIWKDGDVDDFELRLSYRIKNGNSGIQYRSRDFGDWVAGGFQADFEAGDTYSGILYDERGDLGIVAQRGTSVVVGPDGEKKVVAKLGDSAEIQKKIKKEDWNDYVVTVQGNKYKHQINGQTTVEVVDDRPADKQRRSGILALQLHAGPPMTVEFKNVRIKKLKPADKAASTDAKTAKKKIVLLAGRPSHAPGDHEHNAGCQLLARCLNHVPGITAEVYRDGWPKDPSVLDSADSIVFFADGGDGHPAIQGDRLATLDKLLDRGVGMACLHYGVEVPKERGGAEFLRGIGGYFEMHWSVNPHWTANFDSFPEHEITRGVKPFEVNDEWYYHMRFQPDMKGVTPLLTAVPPASTLERPNGPHSGNPFVRAEAGKPQHVAWAYERPEGGRGFGFTGAHHHANWGNPSFRTLVLNALVWTAGGQVPADGVQCEVTPEDLRQNLDPNK